MNTAPTRYTAEQKELLNTLAEVVQSDECVTCPHKSTCTWYISEHRAEIEAIKQDVLSTLPRRQVRNF